MDGARELAGVAQKTRSLASFLGLGKKQLASLLQLAIALMRVGRAQDAIPILRALVALEERCAVFHTYLAVALEKTGALEEAIAEQTIAVAGANDPQEVAESLLLRAELRARTRDVAGARDDLASVSHINAKLDPAWRSKATRLEALLDQRDGGGR